MRRTPIRAKITLVVALLSVVTAVGVVVLLDQMYASSADLLATQSLNSSMSAFATLEEAATDKLGAALEVLRTRDDLRELYVAGDREELVAFATPLYAALRDEYGVTHWYFIEPGPESRVVARIHSPDKYGDVVERMTYREAVESGDMGAGLELGQTAFALRVVMPYLDANGEIIGYMELGQEIHEFLDEMRSGAGGEYAMFVQKTHLDRDAWASTRESAGLEDDWDSYGENLLIDSTSASESLERYEGDIEAIPAQGEVLGRVDEGDRTFVRSIFPVRDASGAAMGGVLVLTDITQAKERAEAIRATLLLVAAVVGIGAMVALIVAMNRLVFDRLDAMMAEMRATSVRVAGGDFTVPTWAASRARDEIGEFEGFFRDFLELIVRALDDLSRRR